MTEIVEIVELNSLPENFFTRNGISIIIGILATGVGFFAGFPETPPIVSNFVKSYPITKWFMVYILILQGSADFNESLALLGTVVIYVIWKQLMYMSEEEREEAIDNFIMNQSKIVVSNEELMTFEF